ncbi:MAG: class I SAM-dependent methyltransferase, partial [Opitutales bacterium]|nr:class I SAM-dependent methyltransferase [Opitutales bacterium]
MKSPYIYDGLEAASYDLVDELSDFDDYAFYRLLIESNPGPVLDLGCGTGRILTPLAGEGMDVVGIDASEEMLAICQEKLGTDYPNTRLIQDDIRKFELKERFATILVPGFSIQLLLETEDLDACLKTCLGHLKPGGQLVMPMYMPWEMLESGSEQAPLELRRESEVDEMGQRYLAWQGWKLDRLEQRLTLTNRFQQLDSSDTVVVDEDRKMTIHWKLPFEMQSRLAQIGFSEIDLYGDFEMKAPTQESE